MGHVRLSLSVYLTVPSVIDDVKLGGATIISQSIGVASSSTGLGGRRFVISHKPAC